MHASILAELQNPETATLETLRQVKQEFTAYLNEARAADPTNPDEDYDVNEDGVMTFEGYTQPELEELVATLDEMYGTRLKAAIGR